MDSKSIDSFFDETVYLDLDEVSVLEECIICKKKIERDENLQRKKQKLSEIGCLNIKICEDCVRLNCSEINNLKNLTKKTIILLKREQARRKIIKNPEISAHDPPTSIKKLERVIKNRVCAQESRDRQKNYVESLVKENKQIKSENSGLSETLSFFKTENNLLKKQICSMFVRNDETNIFKKVIKGVSLALATIISIMILANSALLSSFSYDISQIYNFDLASYKNESGSSIKDTTLHILDKLEIDLDSFLPNKNHIIQHNFEFPHPSLFCPVISHNLDIATVQDSIYISFPSVSLCDYIGEFPKQSIIQTLVPISNFNVVN